VIEGERFASDLTGQKSVKLFDIPGENGPRRRLGGGSTLGSAAGVSILERLVGGDYKLGMNLFAAFGV